MKQNRSYLHHVAQDKDQFTCAICSSAYGNLHKAEECLAGCWRRCSEHARPFILRSVLGVVRFRCPLCLRNHGDLYLAESCIETCKVSLQPHFSFFNLADLPAERKSLHFSKPIRYTPLKKTSEEKSKEEVTKPEAVAPVLEEDMQEVTEQAMSAPVPEAAAANAEKEPKDRTKKFSRDGAKYVCINCKQVKFTKEEVEVCFDSHK